MTKLAAIDTITVDFDADTTPEPKSTPTGKATPRR